MKDRLEIGIEDFSEPTSHPYGMLEDQGYAHTAEKEGVLALMLIHNIKAGTLFGAVKTIHNHDTMIEDGLLEKCEGGYKFTPKSVLALHSVYGRPTNE